MFYTVEREKANFLPVTLQIIWPNIFARYLDIDASLLPVLSMWTFTMHSNGEIGEIGHHRKLCSECAVRSNHPMSSPLRSET